MSIIDDIKALEKAGLLTRFQPPSTRPLKRSLFLSAEALRELNDVNSATNMLVGRGYIQAALVKWVTGGRVYAFGRTGRFLKRLEPPPEEIWEMMVTEPAVQGRLFCRFAKPNTLVLFNFHTRNHLGSRRSKKGHSAIWHESMKTCEQSWNQIFPKKQPFSAQSVHEYITENCDDFDL
jgi:hypothetical protein